MKKQLVKRLLSCAVCTTMVMGMLAGCGSKTEENKDAAAPAESAAPAADAAATDDAKADDTGSKASAGVTLNFAASQNWIQDVDRDLAKAFEEETGIIINFQLSPDDQYQTIIKSKLNTGEGPDIFMSYSGTKLNDFNPEKNMVDLSNEAWVANQEDWAIQTSSYNGKLYAQNLSLIHI